MMFVDLSEWKSGNTYRCRLTMLQSAFCPAIRPWLHSQHSAVHTRQREIAECRTKTQKRRRARSRNGKKTENKKKRDTETRVDRRIEAAAFSRTVNQVLTGDQIGRLVLSARKDGASGLCFLLADAGCRRFLRIFTVIHDASARHLVILTVRRWSSRYGKTVFCSNNARQEDMRSIVSYNCATAFTVSRIRVQNTRYTGGKTSRNEQWDYTN